MVTSRVLVVGFLLLCLGCGGGGGGGDNCLLLGPLPEASVSPAPQIVLQVRFVEVDNPFLEDIGVDLPFLADVRRTNPAFIGSRHAGAEAVVVDAGLVGGATGTQLVVPGSMQGGRAVPLFRPDGLMPAVLDFVTVWPGLPGPGCVEFTEDAGERQGELVVPSALALPDRPGILDHEIAFNILDDLQTALLIDAIELDIDNLLIEVPEVRLHDRQFGFAMVRDVIFPVEDLETDFQTALFAYDPLLPEVESGVALGFAPILGPDDSIQIELRPQVSAVGFADGPTVQDGVGTGLIEVPAIQLRQARTSVVVADGQTVLLGGIRLDAVDAVLPGLPILNEVPIVSGLFPLLSQFDDSRALLILVTPHIVPTTE